LITLGHCRYLNAIACDEDAVNTKPNRNTAPAAELNAVFAAFEALQRVFPLEIEKALAAGRAPLPAMPGLTNTTEPSIMLTVDR
jgi:hypothetical protein